MSLRAIRKGATPLRLVLGALALLILLIYSGNVGSAPLMMLTFLGLLATLAAMLVRSLWRFAMRQTAGAQPEVVAEAAGAAGPPAPDRYGPLLIGHAVCAVIFAVGGLSLLALPGLLIYATASPFVDIIFGPRALDQLPRYGGLAVGFWVNLLWPWALPAAYVAGRGRRPLRPRLNLPIYLGVLYGWAVVSSFIGYLIVLAQ
jgi:hypothetical protein